MRLVLAFVLVCSPGITSAQLAKAKTAPDSVKVLSRMLKANGGNATHANRVALAIQTYSRRHNVDPVLVVGIIGVENKHLMPTVKNRSGATGIMQVMPHWLKTIRYCGKSLKVIETNVCLGTKVLSLAMHPINKPKRTVQHGLFRYNGCTGGRRCIAYARAVLLRARGAERAVATNKEN